MMPVKVPAFLLLHLVASQGGESSQAVQRLGSRRHAQMGHVSMHIAKPVLMPEESVMYKEVFYKKAFPSCCAHPAVFIVYRVKQVHG